MYKVVFINERGAHVTKVFDSEYLCRQFVNKAKHSKRIRLISYPNFYA